jgi:hypothetical protein
MSHQWWLPDSRGRKLFDGMPEHVKEWNEVFQVRSAGAMEGLVYYVAWKGTTRRVEGSLESDNWLWVKADAEQNWKKYLDDEFERQVLIEEGNE